MLTFDLDGVLTDPWTPVEAYLKTLKEDTRPEIYETGIAEIWSDMVHFFVDFSFRRDITDFEMSTLEAPYRKALLSSLGLPQIYRHIGVLPWQMNTATLKHDWRSVVLTENVPQMNYFGLTDWAVWFRELTENGYTVVLHSHLFNTACRDARLAWLNENILNIAPKVQVKLDCGAEKSTLSGDIVFEDCISNLLKAETNNRVLMTMFHNGYSSAHNLQIVEDFGSDPHFICASNLFDVKQIVADYEKLADTGTAPRLCSLYNT